MFLGIDLSSRDVATVLARPDGSTVLALRAPLPAGADSLQAWRTLTDVVQETFIRSAIPSSQIITAVLALNAHINAQGVVEKSVGSDGWHGLNIPVALSESMGIVRGYGVHRAVCEGAGEVRFGSLQNAITNPGDSWLYVHLGATLAAVSGSGGYLRFIDIGEICIERDGALGSSGRRGTLEAYCTEENFRVRAASYGITLREERDVWEMAKSNFAAQSLRDDFVRRLAQGLGAAITVLRPAKTALGGSLAHALGDELTEALRRDVREFAPAGSESLASAALGHDAAVMGAVALAIQYAKTQNAT